MVGTWSRLLAHLHKPTPRKARSPSLEREGSDPEGMVVSLLQPPQDLPAAGSNPAASAEPISCVLSTPYKQQKRKEQEEAKPSWLDACVAAGENDRHNNVYNYCERKENHPALLPAPKMPSQMSAQLNGCHALQDDEAEFPTAGASTPSRKPSFSKYASSLRRAILRKIGRSVAGTASFLSSAEKRHTGASNGTPSNCSREPELLRANVIEFLCKEYGATTARCDSGLPCSAYVFGVRLGDLPLAATSEVTFDGGLHCRVPLVVERCAQYILASGTDVIGIFRICGSVKRMKKLRTLFDTPPTFGTDLQMGQRLSYAVHDCAGVMKRYLMELPEPVISWEFYSAFREVELPTDDDGTPSRTEAKRVYTELVGHLPRENRDLLMFLTATLAVLSTHAYRTFMCVENLAAVFQPGLLSRPDHAKEPEQYARNRRVVAALIRYNLALFADADIERVPPLGWENRRVSSLEMPTRISPAAPADNLRQHDRLFPMRSIRSQYLDLPAGESPRLVSLASDTSWAPATATQSSFSVHSSKPLCPRAPRLRHSPKLSLKTLTSFSPRGSRHRTSATRSVHQRSGCALKRKPARSDWSRRCACPPSTTPTGVALSVSSASCTGVRVYGSCSSANSQTAARAPSLASGTTLRRRPSFLSDRPKRSSTVAPSVPRRSATISEMPASYAASSSGKVQPAATARKDTTITCRERHDHSVAHTAATYSVGAPCSPLFTNDAVALLGADVLGR